MEPLWVSPGLTIHPLGLYTSEQVREALQFRDLDTVYRIPELELPCRRVGPARRERRYRGRDIIRYFMGEEACPSSAKDDRTTTSRGDSPALAVSG